MLKDRTQGHSDEMKKKFLLVHAGTEQFNDLYSMNDTQLNSVINSISKVGSNNTNTFTAKDIPL